jgi:DNA polymerase-3 subunit epsilon
VARKVYRLDSYRLPFVAAEAGFADFPHHNATADALACAHVMIDAANRVGAADIDGLAAAVGVRVSQIAVAEAPAVSFAVA